MAAKASSSVFCVPSLQVFVFCLCFCFFCSLNLFLFSLFVSLSYFSFGSTFSFFASSVLAFCLPFRLRISFLPDTIPALSWVNYIINESRSSDGAPPRRPSVILDSKLSYILFTAESSMLANGSGWFTGSVFGFSFFTSTGPASSNGGRSSMLVPHSVNDGSSSGN